MSCRCCIVDDTNNIILELVTVGFAGVGLFVVLMSAPVSSSLVLPGLSSSGAILASVLGIVALIWPERYRLGYWVILVSIFVFVGHIIGLFGLIGAIPTIRERYYTSADCLGNMQFDVDRMHFNTNRSPLMMSFTLMFGYFLVMSACLVALAAKHYYVCKNIGRMSQTCSCGREHQGSNPICEPSHRRHLNSLNDPNNTDVIMGATLLNCMNQNTQMNWPLHQQSFSDCKLGFDATFLP